MIVVDTSALIAILLKEPRASECFAALQDEQNLLVSAGTWAETLIVASRNNLRGDAEGLLAALEMKIVDVTAELAGKSADAYQRWGKGFHPAALNYGDCFAYALARERDCPLLYIGQDFAQTDVRSALD